MSKELQAWAVHVLRFALREPSVASGDAILHVIDTREEGSGRFRGGVVGGDRAAAAAAFAQARAEGPALPWGLAFVASAPPDRTFMLVDCSLDDALIVRFGTEIRGAEGALEAGPLLYLGVPPDR